MTVKEKIQQLQKDKFLMFSDWEKVREYAGLQFLEEKLKELDVTIKENEEDEYEIDGSG